MNMAVERKLRKRDSSDFVPRTEFESAMLETRLAGEIHRMSDRIDSLRKDTNAEFTAVRGGLSAVRTDVEVIKAQLGNHESKLGDLKTAVSKVQTDVDGLRRDFGQFREETTKEFAAVRTELGKNSRYTLWQMIVIVVAIVLAVVQKL